MGNVSIYPQYKLAFVLFSNVNVITYFLTMSFDITPIEGLN